jgi:predicted GNAT family acetyltransferase
MTADKTGAPTTITRKSDRFTIAVDGKTVGSTFFAERANRRVLYHTEVADEFEGRGLATILVREALDATRADGLRIVPVCPLVAAFVRKHHDFDDTIDRPTPEILDWLESR